MVPTLFLYLPDSYILSKPWGPALQPNPVMTKYFYVDKSGQQAGPISIENFSACGIMKDTLVWCEGMSDWKKAEEVEELKHLFVVATPPLPPTPPIGGNAGLPPTPPTPSSPTDQRPDNYLVWTILTTILCCLPLGIPGIIYATKVEKLWNAGDRAGAQNAAEQAKMWCFISLGGGVLSFIISFCFGFLSAL